MKKRFLIYILLFAFSCSDKYQYNNKIFELEKKHNIIYADLNGNNIKEKIIIEMNNNIVNIHIYEKNKLQYRKKFKSNDLFWYCKVISFPYGLMQNTTKRDIVFFVSGSGYLSILSWERIIDESKIPDNNYNLNSGKYRLLNTYIQIFDPYD